MKSRKPLPRSTKPLKRSSLKQGKGRRAKVKDAKIKDAKDFYFNELKKNVCQWCGEFMMRKDSHGHHKRKRSLGGKDDKGNLVIIHNFCHGQIHGNISFLKKVEADPANAENGLLI